MIEIKKLLRSDIRYACGETYFNRGRNYFDAGRVLSLEVTEESDHQVAFRSTVSGRSRSTYQQLVSITWSPNYTSADIEGTCTCPVAIDCKHVAAACLAFQVRDKNPEKTGAAATPACMTWLDNLHEEANERALSAARQHEFIAYLLKPGKQPYQFTVELVITWKKQGGGLAKGRKTSLSNLHFGYSGHSLTQPEDREIGKLLSVLAGGYQSSLIFTGITGYLAVTRMLQTGRLFWQNLDKPPLRGGEERRHRFVWSSDAKDNQRLRVQIELEAMLLLTDPPLYLDVREGILGPMDDFAMGYGQLQKILALPEIPAEYAEQFSERLLIEQPDLPLPPPREIEVVDVSDVHPQPVLTLYGIQLHEQYQHYMGLSFSYGDWEIPPLLKEKRVVVKTEDGLLRIQRDLEEELSHIQLLTQQGFVTVRDQQAEKLVFFSPDRDSVLESVNRWREFIDRQVPELQRLGWNIDIDSSFLLDFQEVDAWDAEIDSSGNDWFEIQFKVEIDGKPVPLLPLILEVLDEFDPEELPETIVIPAEEHKFISLPGKKVQPFLEILFELFDRSSETPEGALRLSRYDASALADIETQTEGLFSLSGGEALRELGRKIKNFSGIREVPPPAGLQTQLRHYQQQGLNWLQFLCEYELNGILADDMGLGKTVQTLAHLLLEKQAGRMTAPSLIIAPTSLMGNWRREAERFTPDLRVLVLQGPERGRFFDSLPDYDLVLTTYPLLPRDEQSLLAHAYHYLVLDEAQIVKNPRAKAARIIRKIDATHRLSITGMPMENHLGELWAQFDFLMPGFLGSQQQFKKIYRTPIEKHQDSQQRSRLVRRIRPFMLRRSKQEVAAELPPKTEIIRSVPLYEKQAALYESIRLSMEKKVRESIANKGLSRSHITILDALLKLRQTCCDPRTLSLKQAQNIKQSAKLDLLMELLPELLEEGRRILLFSQFTRMLALIETRFQEQKITYSKLTGQTRYRERAIESFRSGEVDVFLISLKAGGVGLNLTEADTVIIYDPWWNPAVESQASDRAHRIGQDKPVFVYKLITENTVEEKILAMREKKRQLAESVYQDGGKEKSLQLSAEDLDALFEPLA